MKKKEIDKKKSIFKGVALWFLTIATSLILALILKVCFCFIPKNCLIATMFGTLRNDWYINTFFSDANASKHKERDNSDVVTIALKESFISRGDIAYVIREVAALKPKLICVDFLFPESASFDVGQSNMLWDAISEIKDTVPVVVVEYKGLSDTFHSSRIIDSLGLEYGLNDDVDYYNYTPFVDDTLPRISALIAKKVGVDLENLPRPLVINYRNKKTNHHAIDSSLMYLIRPTLIKDRIVLIGQYDTPDDMHTTPFPINNRKQIPGVEAIAFEISSLTSCVNDPNNNYRHPYSYVPLKGNILFFIVLSSLYFLYLHCIIYKFLKKDILILLLKSFLLAFAEFLLIKICFFITAHCFLIPNIVILSTSLLFADVFYQIFNKIICCEKE